MGYVSPKIEFNPDIPKVAFDSEFLTVYQDLAYEHVWYLDPQFNTVSNDVWLARITPVYSNGVKNMGYVKPVLERNSEIPNVEFELADKVPYYEFNRNLIWYLDDRFNPTSDRVWALRLQGSDAELGDKDMGTVAPKFILNPDVPRELEYYIDDHVPYFDLGYEHVWMLDDSLHKDNERIWAAKIVPRGESLGVKVVGNIGVKMGNFDVVFISYFEPNAEANWLKLLEVCPTAKRVKNVKGIFEAHKQAAELATTEMFYVVDGDAEILDSWKFDFKPNVFNLDVVHLWTSMNPINGLEYGYGGVKLFPRKLLLEATTWNVDLTTGLGKLIYIPKVSNITGFNTDPFNTWRSAFRECAKLASNLHLNAYNTAETEERLRIWTTVGADKKYGEYALHGANLGKQYGLDNFNKPDELKLINNFEWMKNEFNKFFK
jgi:hypothetical protein